MVDANFGFATPQDSTLSSKNSDSMSVSELVYLLKNTLEGDFGRVAIAGEISSFKAWRSGHWYFDLKDDKALIPAVMFRGSAARVRFEVQEGLEVLVKGKVSVYPAQSKLQLIVESMEPLGQGALALAFEQLKKRLKAEGLFEAENKKPLPFLPRQIGLVTSPQGAALRDMLRIFDQRMPGVEVLIAPCRVQGQGSAQEIADAIATLDRAGNCDVMIVGRGGGSLEDLWSFNEEVVARAVFACQTPVISAVGHETDFSICDFVADKRCATPTHAASDATQDVSELSALLAERNQQLYQAVQSRLTRFRLYLERLSKGLKDPKLILLEFVQRLEGLQTRLQNASPQKKLSEYQQKYSLLRQRLFTAGQTLAERPKNRLALLVSKLEAYSPLSVIARGYSVAFVADGKGQKVLKKAAMAKPGDFLSLRLEDGFLDARVEKIRLFKESSEK